MEETAEILMDLNVKENSLLDAIYERYIDLVDLNGQHTYSMHYKGGSLTRFGLSNRQSENELKNDILTENDVKISINSSPRKPGIII